SGLRHDSIVETLGGADGMPEASEMSSARDALAADSSTREPVSDLMIESPVRLSRASQASRLQWSDVANRNARCGTTSTLNSELARSPNRLLPLVGSKASAPDVLFHGSGSGTSKASTYSSHHPGALRMK